MQPTTAIGMLRGNFYVRQHAHAYNDRVFQIMNLQLTIVANTVAKYVLHGIDLYSENPWENKAVFMLYTELAIGFVKVEQLFNCFG